MVRHVKTCASCKVQVAELRGVMTGIAAATDTRVSGAGACLDELVIAELAERGASAQQDPHIAHLASCGHCRRQLAALVTLLSDADIAASAAEPAHPRKRLASRRIFARAVSVAAAAAVLLLVLPRGAEFVREHRGPTITAGAIPTPISPVGDVPPTRSLLWTAVSGADRYRVTLFDATGNVLLERALTDTVLTLSDSVSIVPGRSYLWKVQARTGFDRWASSELMEFRVRQASSAAEPGSASAAPAQPRDSLRLLAAQLSDSALVVEIKARPLDVRAAFGGTLALAADGRADARAAELVTAGRIARAYRSAWNDPFLMREVERFTESSAERRSGKVWGDSVRRAGVDAFSRDGAEAAVAIWQRALARFVAINDSAGMAATLGNIGAGFAYVDRVDSATLYLRRALTLALASGDMRSEANALSELAGVSEKAGDISAARQQYARAIALRSRIGDSRGLASDYNNVAGLSQSAGDLDAARRQYETALDLNQRDGRPEVAATNLVNLAGLASLSGDFVTAETYYRGALTTWRPLARWADVADALRGLGGMELRRGDYPAARTHLAEALTIYTRTGPLEHELGVRRELANTRAASGQLQDALDELRRAQQIGDSARVAPDVRADILLARADLAVQLNARTDAERLYENAEALFRASGGHGGEAEAQHGRGLLLLDHDDLAGAQALFDAALRTETALGNQRGAALVRLSLGALSLRNGDTVAARQLLARAAAELKQLGDPVAAAAALGERADLEAEAQLPAAAESLYRSGLAMVGLRIAPEITWRLHAGLGSVRRSQGATDEAARELNAAIADIERTGRSIQLAERRSGFLTDKWDVYIELAALERGRGRTAVAFDVSERLRASEMLETLSRGRVTTSVDTAAELVTREQDLRHRIAELTRDLEGVTEANQVLRGPDVSRAGAVTREALLRAQETYADLLLEMRERAPRHSALVTRETAGWRDVAVRLAGDEVFVEYLLNDEASSMAFVITRDTVVTVELGGRRRELARRVEFLRGTLEPRGNARLDSLWREPLRQLYRDLIAPIERTGLLAGKTRLILVPHADLHYLPFAALLSAEGVGRGQFLVEKYQLTVTPSASVWLALADRTPVRASEGMIAFAPRPDVLPASRQEVATITRLGGLDARGVTGSAATETAFKRDAPARRVIHLATYGVLNKQNPLFSYVEFAPGGIDDGRLEAHEVFGLRLSADLVVLSACQTGLASGALSDVPAGDDWIGLARAFLSAGAARVMASLWPVQDKATATLMGKFYEGYSATGGDAAKSLATAQRALIAVPATASPYYWAGFELVSGR
jgi:CHAT domain-containing protein/tetratricopeptide (TPR) repeat protein